MPVIRKIAGILAISGVVEQTGLETDFNAGEEFEGDVKLAAQHDEVVPPGGGEADFIVGAEDAAEFDLRHDDEFGEDVEGDVTLERGQEGITFFLVAWCALVGHRSAPAAAAGMSCKLRGPIELQLKEPYSGRRGEAVQPHSVRRAEALG